MASATTRRPCATHADTKTTKGWKSVTTGQRRRRALKAKCPNAFAYDGKHGLHFPLMPEGSTACCVDCKGSRVAYARARQWASKYPGTAEKIRARSKAAGCAWAQHESKR